MSSKRPRTPRAKLPADMPLDDWDSSGTETWRTIDGVTFHHWDRELRVRAAQLDC